MDTTGGSMLMRVETSTPRILAGTDITFPSSGGPRRTIEALDGLNMYSSDFLKVGNSAKPWELDFRTPTGDNTLRSQDFAAVIGAEVRLDGGQPNDPGDPTYGTLARLRRNGLDDDQPEDRLLFETTASQGADGQLSIQTAKTQSGWNLEFEAEDGAGNLKRITLRGNVEIYGPGGSPATLLVQGAGTFEDDVSVQGDLSAQGNITGQSELIVQGAAPGIRFDNPGSGVQWRVETQSTELSFVREESAASTNVIAIQRDEVPIGGGGTRFITRIQGPGAVTSPDTEEGVIAFGDRATILCDEGPAELVAPEGFVSVSDVDGAGVADAAIVAGALGGASSTAQSITLGAASNASVLRFGTVTAIGGSGGVTVTLDDRFRVEGNGRMRIWDAASTGSPGTAAPVLDFNPSGADAVMNVGDGASSGGFRGRVFARRGNSSSPGLVVLEADDGTPVFLSAWRVAGQIEVIASSSMPTSFASGNPICAPLP